MKLDFPRYSERVGAVSIHTIQRIYELDSGRSRGFHSSHQTIKKFDYDELSNIIHEMAIVIPVRDEKLKLLEGVLSGIPNEALVIVISNSKRAAVDRYGIEADTVQQLSRFMDKKILMIHQSDPGVAETFSKLGYDSILDAKGKVRDGKAEGMVLGILLAKMFHKDYVGFIDADNYIPGAVNEYVKIFAAGFGMSAGPYSCVRVSWVYKPKVKENALHFAKWGRVSEITNRYVNGLLSHITGFETEIVKTGNSGEHAFSMALAERLHFSSGYSVETHEIIDILETFGGLVKPDSASIPVHDYRDVVGKGVEIFQIETRNPHFHADKGNAHLVEMLEASLLSIFRSPLCPESIRRELLQQDTTAHLKELLNAAKIANPPAVTEAFENPEPDKVSDSSGVVAMSITKASEGRRKSSRARFGDYLVSGSYPLIAPIRTIPMKEFEQGIRRDASTFFRFGGIK